jgi:hypothetical protein
MVLRASGAERGGVCPLYVPSGCAAVDLHACMPLVTLLHPLHPHAATCHPFAPSCTAPCHSPCSSSDVLNRRRLLAWHLLPHEAIVKHVTASMSKASGHVALRGTVPTAAVLHCSHITQASGLRMQRDTCWGIKIPNERWRVKQTMPLYMPTRSQLGTRRASTSTICLSIQPRSTAEFGCLHRTVQETHAQTDTNEPARSAHAHKKPHDTPTHA